MSEAALERKPIGFYGWWIVVSCFLCQGFAMGLVGVYGLFLVPLATEFNTDMGTLSLGMSIYLLCMGGTAPLVGMLMNPGRIKTLMLLGVLLSSTSLALIGQADSLGGIAIMIAAFAFTAAGFGILPTNILLANWFNRLRGRAMAISAMGSSVASFILPPLTAFWVANYGWRTAFEFLGLLLAGVLIPVISLLVIESPGMKGQQADGDGLEKVAESGKGKHQVIKIPVPGNKELFRDKNFWFIGILFGIFYTTAITQAVHFIPFLISIDLDTQQAAWVIAALGASGMLGKVITGTLADRFRYRILWLVFSLQLVPMFAWVSLSQLKSFDLYTLFCACLLGLSGGGMIPMHAFVNSHYFGPAAVGRVTGFHSPMLLPAGLFAAPLAGWVIDASGNYGEVFVALACALVITAFISLLIGRPKYMLEPATSI